MTLGWPVPDTRGDRPYWRELNDLASILARQIRGLPPIPPSAPSGPAAASTPSAPTTPPAAGSGGAASTSLAAKSVWIADPTDDVLVQWETLSADLRAKGYGVLPQAAGHYPCHEETLYRQALASDLARADLLVQLLGSLPGRKPAWADARFVRIQAEAARAETEHRQITLLSWRSPDIDLNGIPDPAHQTLLAAATGPDFKIFCRSLIESLAIPPPASPPPPIAALSVVINADPLDRDLGKQTRDLLGALEVDATLAAEPIVTQEPAKYRRDLEALLEYNHGVLIIYGLAPPTWVQAQYAMARKVLATRDPKVWGALLEGPPEDKPEHGLKSRNLMVLDCRRGLSPDPLKGFVEKLRQGL